MLKPMPGFVTETISASRPGHDVRNAGRRDALAIVVLLFAVVLAFQYLGGAFTAELSGYPDEASHYMSGLLVHDYIQGRFPSSPMTFAIQFYLHYPYLAIGHWPPVFYAVEGSWMYLFSTSRIAVLLLMAGITTSLVAMTYFTVQRESGVKLGLLSALLLASIPTVQKFASLVMMDTLLAVLSLWAVLCFARFLDSGRWRDAMSFAGLASVAILTKGNAFFLALVPGIALLMTRRFHLLKRASFWAPAAVVALLCLPWHLMTMGLMLPTFGDHLGVEFTRRAAGFYGALLLKSFGAPILGLAAAGIFTRVIKPFRYKGVDARSAALGSLLASLCIFYCVVPAGIEPRYAIAGFPLLLIFAVAGAVDLAGFLAIVGLSATTRLRLILAVAVIVFATNVFAIPRKVSYGFREAATALLSAGQARDSLILVSTDTNLGEGIFVSEMAMQPNRGREIVLRASKVLADSDWNITTYTALYATGKQMRQCLKEAGVEFLVLDRSPGSQHFLHHRQLLDIVRSYPEEWRLVGTYSPTNRDAVGSPGVQVYRYAGAGSEQRRDPLCSIRTNLDGNRVRWPITIRLACSQGLQESAGCYGIP